jgi:hypothetical protein
MRWANVHRCSVKATAAFDPVLHAVTLKLSTTWRTSATIEHAPPQLFVESGNIRIQPSFGVGGLQRRFFSCQAKWRSIVRRCTTTPNRC